MTASATPENYTTLTDVTDLFRQSIGQAHQQQALYWELSAAISLAELLRGQNKDAEARAVLGPVYDRFTEGFSAVSLKRAKSILGGLHSMDAARDDTNPSRTS